jgi:TPR repeat protein
LTKNKNRILYRRYIQKEINMNNSSIALLLSIIFLCDIALITDANATKRARPDDSVDGAVDFSALIQKLEKGVPIPKTIKPHITVDALNQFHQKAFPQPNLFIRLLIACEKIREFPSWTQTAINRGNEKEASPLAHCNLGSCYEQAIGVEKDFYKAFEFYTKAANKGFPLGQYHLGLLYQHGRGTKKDLAQAMDCWHLAADQGYAQAQCYMGALKETIIKDTAASMYWFKLAADQGHPSAFYYLGVSFYKDGAQQDYAKAVSYFQKAAGEGEERGYHYLGLCYYHGEGVSQSYTQAASYVQKAADQGDAEAQNLLGWLYYKGYGIPQDDTKAASYWQTAADNGICHAQYNLGLLYQNELGVPWNIFKAIDLFYTGASSGDKDCQTALKTLVRLSASLLKYIDDEKEPQTNFTEELDPFLKSLRALKTLRSPQSPEIGEKLDQVKSYRRTASTLIQKLGKQQLTPGFMMIDCLTASEDVLDYAKKNPAQENEGFCTLLYENNTYHSIGRQNATLLSELKLFLTHEYPTTKKTLDELLPLQQAILINTPYNLNDRVSQLNKEIVTIGLANIQAAQKAHVDTRDILMDLLKETATIRSQNFRLKNSYLISRDDE